MEDAASLPLLQVIFLLVLTSGYFSTIVSGSLFLVPNYLLYLAILIVALVLVAMQCCRLVAGAAAANVAAWLPVLLLQTWLPSLQQVGHRHRCCNHGILLCCRLLAVAYAATTTFSVAAAWSPAPLLQRPTMASSFLPAAAWWPVPLHLIAGTASVTCNHGRCCRLDEGSRT
jgi:hypothetical protein